VPVQGGILPYFTSVPNSIKLFVFVIDFLTLCSPNYYREFKLSGPNKLLKKSLIFEFQKQLLNGKSLWKTKIKHLKEKCRFELDLGPGTKSKVVELYSTLE